MLDPNHVNTPNTALTHTLNATPQHTQHRQSLKTPKFTQSLVDVIKEAGLTGGCAKQKGNLLYTVATKVGVRARGGGRGGVQAEKTPVLYAATAKVGRWQEGGVAGAGL